MPGLIGFVRTMGHLEGAELIAAMARALEPHDGLQRNLYSDGNIGLGRVSLGLMSPAAQPLWNAQRTLCLIMEGELYDTAELKRCLEQRGHRFETGEDAELLLRLVEEFGPEGASRLNGAFVAAVWYTESRTLFVVNDRLGLFPLYYSWSRGRFVFSSGVRGVIADPEISRETDPLAIGQFLVFDHLLHDRTLLGSVKLLPQATILKVHNGDLTFQRYWTPRYPEVYRPQSDAFYVEEMVRHLRAAVRRQKPDIRRAALSLSGGLDSRILLALLREVSPAGEFRTFTWGIPNCDDAKFSKEVAERLDTSHTFLELRPDWLLKHADSAVRLTDGLGNIVNLHALATLEEERRDAELIYKGFLGDAMLGFAVARRMWANYEPEIETQIHLQTHTDNGVINYDAAQRSLLFSAELQNRVADGVLREYKEGMAKSETAQLANQRLYFDLTQRVPRMTINGVEVMRSQTIVRLPFADNNLVDFALTVPPGYMFERYLIKAAITRYFPELARIPVTPSGLPLAACARSVVIQGRQLVSWHLRKKRLGWLAGPDQRPYKDYNGWFRTVLRSWVEDTLLSERSLRRGYFNADYVRKLVSDHMSGTNHAVRIGALMTLELWHRQFLDRN